MSPSRVCSDSLAEAGVAFTHTTSLEELFHRALEISLTQANFFWGKSEPRGQEPTSGFSLGTAPVLTTSFTKPSPDSLINNQQLTSL